MMTRNLLTYIALFVGGLLLGTTVPALTAQTPSTLAERIQSECESLVDLAHRDKDRDRIASREAIRAELLRQGANLPPVPTWDPRNSDGSRKSLDEHWEQVRNLPEYNAAWSAARDKVLKEGVYECVTIRLAKEGVRR